MAAINFPDTPAPNEEFTAAGRTFVWNDTLDVWESSPEFVTFNAATDAATAGITIDEIAYSAVTRLNVTSSGMSAYLFNNQYSGNNPTLYAAAGTTIAFNLSVSGHPFLIRYAGANYNTGLVHVSTTGVVNTGANAQGKTSGTLYWQIPSNISGDYGYLCSIHAVMNGIISVHPIDEVPSQTGNSGKLLTTNGTNAAWSSIINSSDAAQPAIIARQAPSATANMQEWQDSSGTRLASIGPAGEIAATVALPLANTSSAKSVGYVGMPQDSQTTGAQGLTLNSAGKHIYSTATRTVTLPDNAGRPLEIGTTFVFVSGPGATTTISIGGTDTLYLAGAGTTGSRTLAPFGMATAVKITATSWIISGNGLS